MVFRKLGDFYKRFKPPVDEQEEFYKFRKRVYSLIRDATWHSLNSQVNKELYGLLLGSPGEDVETLLQWYILDAASLPDLLKHLEMLFAVLEAGKNEDDIDNLYQAVSNALLISPLIGVVIGKNEHGMVFYPNGAEVLDPALIEDVLNWLGDYPEVNKHYMEALKLYLTREPSGYRNLLDNLRASIEELLRTILGNQKSLENQTKDLRDWLDGQGVNPQIANLYGQLLFGPYRILQNEDVKHGSGLFTEAEVEYLLYLSGTFMRLLIRINQTRI